MKDKSLFPAVASTKRSMCGSGKLSFGHALLRSVKSMHTRHFLYFFLTMTGLACQSGYLTSVMDPTLRRFSTSSLTAPARSGPSFHLFCLIGLKVGSTLSSWHVMLISIPGMSSAAHANVFKFIFRQAISSIFRDSLRFAPILTQRSGNASYKYAETTGSQVGSCFPSKTLATRDCQKTSVSPCSGALSMADDFFFFIGITSAKGFFRFNSAATHTREIL